MLRTMFIEWLAVWFATLIWASVAAAIFYTLRFLLRWLCRKPNSTPQ